MKDGELRGLVLEQFYAVRNDPNRLIDPLTLPGLHSIDQVHLLNVCEQLSEHGLLHWKSLRGLTTIGGMGYISAHGVDVIEGTAHAPITVVLHDHSISIRQASNVQIGNSNTITSTTEIHAQDLTKVVETLATHLGELALDERERQRAEVQLAALKVELSGDPDPTIVNRALLSIRNITEGAIGSLLAAATQPSIWNWIHQMLASVRS